MRIGYIRNKLNRLRAACFREAQSAPGTEDEGHVFAAEIAQGLESLLKEVVWDSEEYASTDTDQNSAIENWFAIHGAWSSHPVHRAHDWRDEVACGNTELGYREWAIQRWEKVQQEKHNKPLPPRQDPPGLNLGDGG